MLKRLRRRRSDAYLAWACHPLEARPHALSLHQAHTPHTHARDVAADEHRGPSTGDMSGHIPFACFGLPLPPAGTHRDATLAVCPSNLLPHSCLPVRAPSRARRIRAAPHATRTISQPAARPLVRPGSHGSAFDGAAGSPRPGRWPPLDKGSNRVPLVT
jgi:hypothetical protein